MCVLKIQVSKREENAIQQEEMAWLEGLCGGVMNCEEMMEPERRQGVPEKDT